MRIERTETRKNFPISRKTIFKRTIEATILLVILLLVIYFFGVTAFFWDFDKSSTLTAIIVLIVFLVAYTYERAYFASYFYDLAETYLIIKKHPIMPREVTIPYERISGITIDRDVFDFFLGLWDFHIETDMQTGTAIEAHIDGLSREDANGLQGLLTAKREEAMERVKKGPKKEQKL